MNKPETDELHRSIKAAIAAGRQAAANAQRWNDETGQEAHSKKEDTESPARGTVFDTKSSLSIVPYVVVKSISMLDNIYETRLFGWLLAKAQSVLKLYNKDLSDINVQHALDITRVTIPARLLISDESKNYHTVTKAFTLADKKLKYEKNNVVYYLNIIAFPELKKDGRKSLVTFIIHSELWHALLDFTKGYRLFNLETYMKLNSKYSVFMYLLISQQSGVKTYSIDTLRRMMNCDKQKAYDLGSNFFARIIEPARKELIEKAPWYFDYTAEKEGRRHKLINIVITPVLNKNIVLQPGTVTNKASELKLRLDSSVSEYIMHTFDLNAASIEKFENLVLAIGDVPAQLAYLGSIKERVKAGNIKNPAGYLVKCLKNHVT